MRTLVQEAGDLEAMELNKDLKVRPLIPQQQRAGDVLRQILNHHHLPGRGVERSAA